MCFYCMFKYLLRCGGDEKYIEWEKQEKDMKVERDRGKTELGKEGQIEYGKTKGMGKECRINYTKARKLEKQ